MVAAHNLKLDPVSAASGPLYQQVIEAIKREIVSGRLPPGSPMPSFRVLAESLAVSLITVKRAYEELEREGIIYRRQGLGTFVADAGDERTRESRVAATMDALRAAIATAREAGLSDRELMRLLREELGDQ